MSEKEKQILETFGKLIPKLAESDKKLSPWPWRRNGDCTPEAGRREKIAGAAIMKWRQIVTV